MSDRFYKAGLRFECQRCSRCCRHTPGFVFLAEEDLQRLMMRTGLARSAFLDRYCRTVNLNGIRRVSLIEKSNLDCIFWEDGGCSVYSHRPLQCRSYPFWAANLGSAAEWEDLKVSCRGVGKGRLHSAAEIDRWLEEVRGHPLLSVGGREGA